MERTLRNIAIVFTGGAIGGFFTTLAATVLPLTGIVAATGSNAAVAPHGMWFLDPATNYRLMVWGGFFGLFFLLGTFKTWNWPKWAAIVVVVVGPYVVYLLGWGMVGEEGESFASSPIRVVVVLLYFAGIMALPLARNLSWWKYGLIIGVVAGSSSLFVMFPIAYGGAMFGGMPLGPGTIPWVIVFNLFYGVSTAYFVHRAKLID